MTERTAIILLFTALNVVLVAAILILGALGAGDQAIAFAYLVVLSVGGLSCGSIVVHYADKPSSERDRR
jgi:hypothetical protein